MSTKPAPPPTGPPAGPPAPVAAPADVRAARPYLLTGRRLRSLARRILSVGALVGLDVLGLTLGIYLALVLREVVYGNTPILWGLLWEGPKTWLPFLVPITVLVFWQARLYNERESRAGLGTIVSSLVLVALVVLAFGLGTDYDFTTSGLVPVAAAICAFTISALRAAYASITSELLHRFGVKRRVVLVGGGAELAALYRTLGSTRGGIDYEFVGAITPEPSGGLRALGDLDDLGRVLAELRPSELILAEAGVDETRVLEIVEEAHRCGVRVRLAPKTTELLVQRGEYVPGQGTPLFELRPPVLAGADWAVKRAFDLVVSLVVLVGGLPLWLLIAAAIKLDSRGPVFYSDRRVGVGEGEFAMLKFRTMVDGADRRIEEVLRQSKRSEKEWLAIRKLQSDPRVTPAGRFLRRYCLDELPQLFNVILGDMSVVGPRPIVAGEVPRYGLSFADYCSVKPGITGLWQVSGRHSLTYAQRVQIDACYARTRSLGLDLKILLRTIPILVRGDNV